MKTNLYIENDGLYYKFDPRAKLIITLLCSILLFLKFSLSFYYIFTFAIILFSVWQVGFKASFRTLKLIMPIVILMFVLSPISLRDGEAIIVIKDFVLLTRESLDSVLLISFRFIILSYLFTLFFQTTNNRDIILTFQSFGLPYSAALMLSMSFRFIPSVVDTVNIIKDSHKLRDPIENKKKKQKNEYVKVLTSAIVVSVKQISDTAASLELKGYGKKIEKKCKNHVKTDFYTLNRGFIPFLHILISFIIPIIIYFIFRSAS